MKFFFILFMLFSLKSFSQIDTTNLFNNDSIKYTIVKVSEKGNSSLVKVSFHYIKIDISKELKKYLFKLDDGFWLKHLSNETSDWATNLLLYYLYRRDAIVFLRIYTDREKWLRRKNEDIAYWEGFFNGRHK